VKMSSCSYEVAAIMEIDDSAHSLEGYVHWIRPTPQNQPPLESKLIFRKAVWLLPHLSSAR